jgi:acetyl-CoA carboxylase biotin carboxyl carrier protein
MKAKEIQDLISFIANSGLDEVNIETDQFKIKVKKNADVKSTIVQAVSPVAQVPAAAETGPKQEEVSASNNNYVEIKSPMIGTFYRSQNPESDSFVNVGDSISAGQTVCIVEAMKLFNEIESDISGTIVKVLIENSSPVEYDQPLFLVDPS